MSDIMLGIVGAWIIIQALCWVGAALMVLLETLLSR